jgi:NAD(P)-dependent dehydrogenase (short-subunit alcohol dehydrogenase family)
MSTGLLLDGTAFITGAGSGIGQYTAYSFAKYGVKKFGLTDIKPEGLQETVKQIQAIAKDVEVEVITMNVAIEEEVISAVEKVVKRFGRIDYAVNNAGIAGEQLPSADLSLESWQRTMNVNLHVSVPYLIPNRKTENLTHFT